MLVPELVASPGIPLEAATRAYFEHRLGHDFSRIRVHTDHRAAKSAESLNAAAYTVGRDIVFGRGHYAPGTRAGLRRLAHELTHTLQQSSVSSAAGVAAVSSPGDSSEREADRIANTVVPEDVRAEGRPVSPGVSLHSPTLQRELLAYIREQSRLQAQVAFDPAGGDSMISDTYSADATGIHTALAALIATNKVRVVDAGERRYFIHSGATRAELEAAFTTAHYARATEMAGSILDNHNVFVYSRERVTRLHSFITVTAGTQPDVLERQTRRLPTDYERREIQRVFSNRLELNQVWMVEDPLMGSLGYARTLPGTIYFPPGAFGSSRFMPWLIHEMAHVWQYTRGYTVIETLYHALRAIYDYGGQAGLQAAAAAGRTFTSFNTEQQADILKDYYRRLNKGDDITDWQPFVNQMLAL